MSKNKITDRDVYSSPSVVNLLRTIESYTESLLNILEDNFYTEDKEGNPVHPPVYYTLLKVKKLLSEPVEDTYQYDE